MFSLPRFIAHVPSKMLLRSKKKKKKEAQCHLIHFYILIVYHVSFILFAHFRFEHGKMTGILSFPN